MAETRFQELSCGRLLENMDLYLDRELADNERQHLLRHFATCADCARELDVRSELKNRLKMAVSTEPVAVNLETRIRQALNTGARRTRPGYFARIAMPVAAMLAVGVGLTITYQLGHLRFTVASQEAYISSISERVPWLLRVGLGDHVHCTVFRKLPANRPSFAQMAETLGPQYKDLLPVVNEQVKGDYRVVMGHRCSYHRRKFVHISMTDGSRLVSLVIAKRGEGEAFDKAELPAILADGIPMYRASVQRFSIAAFETREHLVYVVSDLGQDDNARMLAAMGPGIRAVLRRVEQIS